MPIVLEEQQIQRATSLMLSDWLTHHADCESFFERTCSCGLQNTLAVLLGDEPYTMMAVRGAHVDIPIYREFSARVQDAVSPVKLEVVGVRYLEIGRPRVVRFQGRLIVLSRTQ